MAAMGGYVELLKSCGHKFKMFINSGLEMKQVRLRAAKHIFEQCKRAQQFSKEAKYNDSVVETSDIEESGG